MKVLICLISSHDYIVSSFSKQQGKLIPNGSLKTGTQPIYKFATFNPNKSQSISFEKYLLGQTLNCCAVLLLIENKFSTLVSPIKNAVFFTTFSISNDPINNTQNFFFKIISPLLNNFSVILRLMNDADKAQAMSLPIRNFNAPELTELTSLVEHNCFKNNFVYEVEATLAKIMKRKLPRSRSTQKTKYFIDDERKYFEYGKETHSRFATGSPHVTACQINGSFRFGKEIDTSRHYNVSRGDGNKTTIAGMFTDCHGQINAVTKCTHLNMFSNDFF